VLPELWRAARPFSWINTALPFLAMAWAVKRGLTPSIVLGTLYFLAPYNLLLYGVNDVYDYESDRLNPRKGGAIQGGLVAPSLGRRLWVTVAVTNVPFLLLLGWSGGLAGVCALLVTDLTAIVYSMPPLHTKVIPILDSATSSLHFVLPAICGGIVAGASFVGLPWRLLLAFFLWGVASHALGAIQDVRWDREAGVGSVAVSLGARNTALLSLYAYSGAVLLVTSWGGAALIPAAALLPYVLLAASCLSGDTERQARRAWNGFLGLNLLTGFIITQVLLRVWGAGSLTVLQLLAWGSALGVLVILLNALANERAMRRRAGPPARWPSVTMVIPTRNEAHTIGACLRGVRSQRYAGSRETIVVDDGSTDGTPELVAAALGECDRLLRPGPAPSSWTGKCWVAHHGVEAARGEVLVFLDADTVLEPFALNALVSEIEAQGGLLSILTRYRMDGWAERVFMSAFVHMQLCFLPIAWMNASRHPRPSLAYAYGPCMATTRREYEASGGHAAIRASGLDDAGLARRMRAAGYRTRLLHGADLASTRHYRNLEEITACWRRTYYAYGGNSLAVALLGMLGVATVFLLPLALLVPALLIGDGSALIGSATGLVGLLVLRIALARRERQPNLTLLAHPLTWLGTLLFQAVGVADGLRGIPPRWRGRTLPLETSS